MVVVITNSCCARAGDEIVVDDVVVEDTSRIRDSVCSLIVVYYVVDVLRVGFGKWLTVVATDPEVSVVGRLISFDVCSELLTDGEGDDGIGDCDVGHTDAIN